MEHKLIQGGEQYLPFARSRIKALRATGLNYASQKFVLPDGEVRVRIVGEHEYIELTGTESGLYLVLPANDTYPSGDTVGATVPAVASIAIGKQAVLTVDDHSILESAPVNWKSGNKFVSYNHGIRYRYRLDRAQDDLSASAENIYFNGVKYLTGGHIVAGAGIFRTELEGAIIQRFVIFTRISNTLVIAYAAVIGSLSWTEIGRINISGGGAVTITEPNYLLNSINTTGGSFSGAMEDPWFMNPNGNQAASLITSDSTPVKRAVRCVIHAEKVVGVVTLFANFTVGEHVGAHDNSTLNILSLGTKTTGPDQPAGTLTRTCHTGFTNIYGTFVPGDTAVIPYVRTTDQYNDWVGVGLLPSQSPQTSTYVIEEVVGIDFLASGQEVLITRKITINYANRPNTFNGTEGVGSTQIEPGWVFGVATEIERGLALSGPNANCTDTDNRTPAFFTLNVTKNGSTNVAYTYFVGDAEIFSVSESTGFSYEYLSEDAGDTEISSDVAQSIISRVGVHYLDGRDKSAIYEHVVQTVDTDPAWNHVTTAENLAVRDYTMKSTAKVIYKSVEVLSQDLEAITPFSATQAEIAAAGATGFIFVKNSPGVFRGLSWTIAELNTPDGYANPPLASMASRKPGEFIASMKFKQTMFGAKLTINSASFIANPSTIQLIKKDAVTAPTIEMNKIPLHAPTGYFRMMPVCVI